MTAEVLREASRLMRERAEAATPSDGWRLSEASVRIEYRPHFTAIVHAGTAENAAHIASWHPAVSLAVADWLDHEADCAVSIDIYTADVEVGEPAKVLNGATNTPSSLTYSNFSRQTQECDPHALAVASAYLGDPA